MTRSIERARQHAERIVFRTETESYTYAQLLERSGAIASALMAGLPDLEEERVAFLAPAGMPYTELLWGIWRAGGIAVPLSTSATANELEHILRTAGVRRVLLAVKAPEVLSAAAASAGASCLETRELGLCPVTSLPVMGPERRAMIVFTSGTTNLPKGVVWHHGMLDAQIEALVQSWEWREDDCIPLFLPLHHIHGIMNVLSCALWSGACVEPFTRFEAEVVLQRVRQRAYTLFMAVPTVYVKLIQVLESLSEPERKECSDGFGSMRLMVSGSAALPVSVHEKWQSLTGQVLLERYGMTEIGMALSNPLRGERRPGAVGVPLPGMEVQLTDESGVRIDREEEPGEIWVRGSGVFLEYWNNPEATAGAFTDGWFRTGDIAVKERGYYRIMGRHSVDIIKSGGYKLSALEIEHTLLSHPAIAECAVLGLPDDTWGELVCAVIVANNGQSLGIEELREWCAGRLSDYKQPRRLEELEALPRNALGKVLKPALTAQFKSKAGPSLS